MVRARKWIVGSLLALCAALLLLTMGAAATERPQAWRP